MDNLKKYFYYYLGQIYFPDNIKNKDNLLLHISDTPSCIYGAINKLIKEIKPKYIVHTGDVADNIKLEFHPKFINRYEKSIKKLIYILENSSAEKIYIAIGNHDNKSILQKHIKKSILLSKEKLIIENNKFYISHFPKDIKKSPSQINMFGHNLNIKTKEDNKKLYLNGLLNIHVYDLNTKELTYLLYPYGTDYSRLKKRKPGI
ncbi:MAG: metallophosphoesterase [Firmicutes bacterium]|nr:metallophosphoesterase [Bacillota bacterium]